jgi:hypothetical protein
MTTPYIAEFTFTTPVEVTEDIEQSILMCEDRPLAYVLKVQGTYAIEFHIPLAEDIGDERIWGSRADILALIDKERAARLAYHAEFEQQMREQYAIQISLHTAAGVEVPEHSRAELEEMGFDVESINKRARLAQWQRTQQS